jgi:LCP family protein required for cell wall assembly
VIVLLLILAGAGIYIYNLYNAFDEGVTSSYEPTDRERSDLRKEDASVNESFTVLILGTDENDSRAEKDNLAGDDFRTDSMILATFDKNEDDVKLVNIPRDTLAYINTEEYFDKINHAHMYGGPSASMETVETLLNVPVDYYVRLNMAGVVDIVDSVGGIEFDVPFDMDEPDQHDKGRIKLEKGVQELSGEEALAVVRSRRVDSDLGRGNRQIELVEAVLNKVKSSGGLKNIDDLIKVVADNTKHSFTSKEIRSLASYYAFNDISFDSTQLKGSDFWEPNSGAYFYRPDEEHIYVLSNTIRSILGMDESDPNDLINIRLADFLTPYQYLDDYTLNEYKLEETPFYAEEGYESPYGDGFETEEFNYQESDVEGETEIEENPEDDPSTEETNPNEQTDPNQQTDPNTENNQEEYNEVPAEEGYNTNQDDYYDNSGEENYDDGSYY